MKITMDDIHDLQEKMRVFDNPLFLVDRDDFKLSVSELKAVSDCLTRILKKRLNND